MRFLVFGLETNECGVDGRGAQTDLEPQYVPVGHQDFGSEGGAADHDQTANMTSQSPIDAKFSPSDAFVN
jgi:hypothetical protein